MRDVRVRCLLGWTPCDLSTLVAWVLSVPLALWFMLVVWFPFLASLMDHH